MKMFSIFAPMLTSNFMQEMAAAPAPRQTILASSRVVPTISSALIMPAAVTIAVPCWSSWKTGMSHCSISAFSISKHSCALMSSRLMPPKVMEIRFTVSMKAWAFGVDFDIEYVNASKTLEQNALTFHHWLGSQWTEVTQAKNGSAIGDDGYQIALAGVLVGKLRITGNFAHRFGHAWAVSQGQIAGCRGRFGEFYAQFPRARIGVIVESGSFQI